MSNLVTLKPRASFMRVRALEIDGANLVAMMQSATLASGRAVAFDGMPADARVVGCRTLKFAVGKVILLIESAEFPLIDTAGGGALPSLDVMAATVTLKEPEPEVPTILERDLVAEQIIRWKAALSVHGPRCLCETPGCLGSTPEGREEILAMAHEQVRLNQMAADGETWGMRSDA